MSATVVSFPSRRRRRTRPPDHPNVVDLLEAARELQQLCPVAVTGLWLTATGIIKAMRSDEPEAR